MIDPKIISAIGQLDQIAAGLQRDDPQAIEKAQSILLRVIDTGDVYLLGGLIEGLRALSDEAVKAKRKGEA